MLFLAKLLGCNSQKCIRKHVPSRRGAVYYALCSTIIKPSSAKFKMKHNVSWRSMLSPSLQHSTPHWRRLPPLLHFSPICDFAFNSCLPPPPQPQLWRSMMDPRRFWMRRPPPSRSYWSQLRPKVPLSGKRTNAWLCSSPKVPSNNFNEAPPSACLTSLSGRLCRVVPGPSLSLNAAQPTNRESSAG